MEPYITLTAMTIDGPGGQARPRARAAVHTAEAGAYANLLWRCCGATRRCSSAATRPRRAGASWTRSRRRGLPGRCRCRNTRPGRSHRRTQPDEHKSGPQIRPGKCHVAMSAASTWLLRAHGLRRASRDEAPHDADTMVRSAPGWSGALLTTQTQRADPSGVAATSTGPWVLQQFLCPPAVPLVPIVAAVCASILAPPRLLQELDLGGRAGRPRRRRSGPREPCDEAVAVSHQGEGVGEDARASTATGHAHLRMRAASVASVAAIAAVLPPVLTAVVATVHPVGDDDRPADGGGGTAPASCCQWHVSLLPSFPRTTRLRRQPRRRR